MPTEKPTTHAADVAKMVDYLNAMDEYSHFCASGHNNKAADLLERTEEKRVKLEEQLEREKKLSRNRREIMTRQNKQIGVQHLELADLTAIVERLPMTMDGVRVVPGDILFELQWKVEIVDLLQRRTGESVIIEREYWDHCSYCECCSSGVNTETVGEYYSTRQAALDAREGGE
jgi:hypothetical protein